MSWKQVSFYEHPQGWCKTVDVNSHARECCEYLEAGGILFFPAVPFPFPNEEREKLLSKKQSGLRFHKNISYRPASDEVRGFSSDQEQDVKELHRIIRNYSQEAIRFVKDLLRPYGPYLKIDYASYRPIEEAGRNVRFHQRNDLLHVDAFPTRPTNGGRILRVFTNINPTRCRSWIISEAFSILAEKYATQAGLDRILRHSETISFRLIQRMASLIRRIGGGSRNIRGAYDQFMLHFHDWLKENSNYQQHTLKESIDFPSGSTWIVYTDTVPHAVLEGQFALEQTFIVDLEGMVTPELAPLRVLERISGKRIAA